MPDPLSAEDIKKFNFYWTPPKKFYSRNPNDEFFSKEYSFILDSGDIDELSTGKIITSPDKNGLVVTANSLEEPNETYELDYLDGHLRNNYFFKVKQDEVPNRIKRAVLISLFDTEDPFHERIKKLKVDN